MSNNITLFGIVFVIVVGIVSIVYIVSTETTTRTNLLLAKSNNPKEFLCYTNPRDYNKWISAIRPECN